MNKKFCLKCNKVTFYEDSLPRGCSHCLSPFASTTASQSFSQVEFEEEEPPRQVIKIKKRPQAEYEEEKYRPQAARLKQKRPAPAPEPDYEEDGEYETSGQFEPPEIEIDIPPRQVEKIESLALSTAPKEKIDRPKVKLNKKQIAEDFKNSMTKGGRANPIEIFGH